METSKDIQVKSEGSQVTVPLVFNLKHGSQAVMLSNNVCQCILLVVLSGLWPGLWALLGSALGSGLCAGLWALCS